MNQASPENPSRLQVHRMFDRIAHRYDLLNRLLSFGRDVKWRKAMARALPAGNNLRVLDLATGTADVLLTLEKQVGPLGRSVGLDRSAGMLRFAREKVARQGLASRMHLVHGDATAIGARTEAFDAVTISFGIRNVVDVDLGLREMHRVLRPGGRALILEFSLPGNLLFRKLYLFYFRHVLPKLGGIISGDFHAYKYLNQTVETFPYGDAFSRLMRDAGFRNVTATPMTMGIATLYSGDKAAGA